MKVRSDIVIALVGLAGIVLQECRVEGGLENTAALGDYCGDRITSLAMVVAEKQEALEACEESSNAE